MFISSEWREKRKTGVIMVGDVSPCIITLRLKHLNLKPMLCCTHINLSYMKSNVNK